jgi:hypothetical protein
MKYFLNKLQKWIAFLCSIAVFFCVPNLFALVVTCTSSTSALTNYSTIFCLSSSTNATPSSSCGVNYPLKIQCTGFKGNQSSQTLASSTQDCSTLSGAYLNVFAYATTSATFPDNEHVADPALGLYTRLFCFGSTFSTDFDVATVTTKSGDCNGYGTTLFSAPAQFSVSGNSHLGDANAYSLKRCVTFLRKQGLSVTMSSNSVGFGTLTSSQTSYATSNGLGTTTPLNGTSSSFYIDVDNTGNTSYAITVQGSTLTSQQNASNTIASIGAVPQTLTPGTDQFGISVATECIPTSSCSSIATSTYPYNTSNYAYAGDTGTSTLIATGIQDDTFFSGGSRFHFKLGANITNNTAAGNYATNLTVIVTSQY